MVIGPSRRRRRRFNRCFASSVSPLAWLVTAASSLHSASARHYEKPPCGPDEIAIELPGVDGVFCSPPCGDRGCPDDTPDGVILKPICALKTDDGSNYCAIPCRPNEKKGGSSDNGNSDASKRTAFECGYDMACRPVPGSGGLGICVYPTTTTMTMTTTTSNDDTSTVVLRAVASPLTMSMNKEQIA